MASLRRRKAPSGSCGFSVRGRLKEKVDPRPARYAPRCAHRAPRRWRGRYRGPVPRPACAAAGRVVHPLEALEDALLLAQRDALASVGHADDHLVVRHLRRARGYRCPFGEYLTALSSRFSSTSSMRPRSRVAPAASPPGSAPEMSSSGLRALKAPHHRAGHLGQIELVRSIVSPPA